MSKFITLKSLDNSDIVININNILKITDYDDPASGKIYTLINLTDDKSVKVKDPTIEIFYSIRRAEKEENKSQKCFSKKEMHTLYEVLRPVLEKSDRYLEQRSNVLYTKKKRY